MSFDGFFDFLPWRKRRKTLQSDDAGEAMELRQEEDLTAVGVEANGRKPLWVYGRHGAHASPALNFLSDVMCSEEFQSGEKICIQLLKYIYQGNIEGLSQYLDNLSKEEITKIQIGGQTLLHILCFKKDSDSLRLLLAHGVQVDLVNADGVTPLHLAVSEAWTEGVEVLLSYGASANTLPEPRRHSSWPFQELPVLTSARLGDSATSSLLLDHSPNLRLTDPDRNTALHLACFSHAVELVSRLLEERVAAADVNSSNCKGNSPLHMLMLGEELVKAEEDIVECVHLLLQKGADINAANAAKKTPLYLAARANLPRVVKALLEAGADPAVRSRDGKTVLHAACRSGSQESLTLLLQSKRTVGLISEEDSFGYAPFHVAVSSCSISCCEVLLRFGEHLTRLDSKGRSLCSLALKNMPSAYTLLKRTFDNSIEVSNKDVDDPEFRIKMNFAVLLSRSCEDVEASLISDLNNSEVESLLKHPLVETFLYLKWHKIKGFFYAYVLLYFLFLIVHTFYIVKTYSMNTDWQSEPNVLTMVHVIHAIMVVCLMVPGTITIFANIRKYFKQWETYCKIIALSTAAFIVFSRESTIRNEEVERNVASVSIFFTWVEFMMLLGRFPSLGVYILMFTRVAKSIIRFLLAFSSLLIAFALAFGILLRNTEVFKSFPTGFVRTLMMMIGEIEYSSLYDNIKTDSTVTMVTSHIFLVVFLFLIPVLMANLLIGLAVNDLPDLQRHGKVRRLVKEASYLESYERLQLVFKDWTCVPHQIINLFSTRCSIKREIIFYPNRYRKYRRNAVYIPSDAVKAAIESGSREASEQHEDLETAFKKFSKLYGSDRERFETALQTLFETVLSLRSAKGVDEPDSCRLSQQKRKIRSIIGRR